MKKRAKPVSAKQLCLRGVYFGPTFLDPPRPRRDPGLPRPRRTWSLPGPVVPIPTDDRGLELVLGPFRVLQDTCGVHFVYDSREPIGRNRVFDARSKKGAVVWMVKRFKSLQRSSPTGPI